MRIIITEIYNRVKELERALRLEADILLHSLCCLQTASAHMPQKTKGGIPDVQGPSQSIWEVKATITIHVFAQWMMLNESKRQEETSRPCVTQAYSAEGFGIKIQTAKWLGLSNICVMGSKGSGFQQEQWALPWQLCFHRLQQCQSEVTEGISSAGTQVAVQQTALTH